jgi:hypothetical protein
MIEDLDDLTLVYMYGAKNGRDSMKDEIDRLRAALFQIAHQKYGSQMSCVDNYNALQTAALAALEGEKTDA